MSNEHEHHPTPLEKPPEKKSWWLTFPGFITVILLIAVGYYLFTEHRAHLFNILPLLILLLCPLMHMMHGGHGGHGGKHHHHKDDNDSPEKRG
ncbi:MAG: DUF2933 domain-containing protein [Gammaproteobacteria bacterium]